MQRIVFQYALYDKCFKQITKYEDSLINSSNFNIHPKENSELAKDVNRCFVNK